MTTADKYERYMLELINADRARLDLAPLKLEKNLNQAAEDHSEWMLATDRFSHTGQGGSSATDRIRDADFNLSGSWRTAENIAVQSERGATGIRDDVADLHQSLMNSPGHYRNLMNPDLKFIGIGIEVGGFDFGGGDRKSVIVTQTFASTSGAVDLDTAAPSVIRGTSDNDVLRGTASADVIRGGTGADLLHGDAGADKLYGGKGADVLSGGRGSDVLFGRGGADRFVFTKGDDRETIRDFQNNRDTLDLRDFGFNTTAQALREADMRSGDAVFDLGNGDWLTVQDTTLTQLANDLLV